MKNSYCKVLSIAVLFLSLCVSNIFCQGYQDSIDDFYMPLIRTKNTFIKEVLDEYQLVVAYVYELPEIDRSEIAKSDRYKTVDRTFKLIEEYVQDHDDDFESAGERGVKFVAVNVNRGDLNSLKTEYALSASDSLLFFYKGNLNNKYPLATSLTGSDFMNFLKQSRFNDFLEDEIAQQERKEARRERQERSMSRRSYYYSRPYVSFGYGSPYYYGPYYGGYWGHPTHYYRPGVSFGIGW